MKKLQILAITVLISILGSANSTYSWDWTPRTTITCHGSLYQIDGKTFCDGNTTISSSNNLIQDTGELETKKMNIAGVNNINASGIGNLTIEHCPTCEETLTVTADKNVLPHIKTDIYGRQLHVGIEDNVNIITQAPINYYAVVKSLDAITASGTINVEAKNTIRARLLNVNMSGSTQMNASMEVEKLIANCSGSSKTTLHGTATDQDVKTSGASRYNAANLRSNNVCSKTSGASIVQLLAMQELYGHASGASNVTYSGAAQNNIKTSGAARVSKV